MGESNGVLELVHEAALRRVRGGFSDPRVLAEAEDIAQETVAKYLELENPEAVLNPGGWANRVAGNLALTRLRQLQRVGGDELEELDETTGAVERFVSEGLMTSYQARIREQASRLIAQLSDREAELIGRVVAGESQEEIAVAMGYASADSVKTTLKRIRDRLRANAGVAGVDPDWQDHPRVY